MRLKKGVYIKAKQRLISSIQKYRSFIEIKQFANNFWGNWFREIDQNSRNIIPKKFNSLKVAVFIKNNSHNNKQRGSVVLEKQEQFKNKHQSKFQLVNSHLNFQHTSIEFHDNILRFLRRPNWNKKLKHEIQVIIWRKFS